MSLRSSLSERSLFTHHSSAQRSYEIESYSVTNTVIMRSKKGIQVWLFSCCQHTMQTASTSSKATEEISLALTTKLFNLHAKKVSVRKAGRGQWSSRGWPPLIGGTALEVKWQISVKQWRMDSNKNNTQENSRSFWKSSWTCQLVSPLTTWAVVFLALRQDLLKEPQGEFHSFSAFFVNKPRINLTLVLEFIKGYLYIIFR